MTSAVGTKRGRGRGSFIDSVLDAVDLFYGEVRQHLKAWSAAPPKLPDSIQPPVGVPTALSSTALSSQDGAEEPDAGGAAGAALEALTTLAATDDVPAAEQVADAQEAAAG